MENYALLHTSKTSQTVIWTTLRPQYTQGVVFCCSLKGKKKFEVPLQQYTVTEHPNTTHAAGTDVYMNM